MVKPSIALTAGILAAFTVAPASARMYNNSLSGGANNNALIQSAIADSLARRRAEQRESGERAKLDNDTTFNECGDLNVGPQIAPGAEAPDTVVIVADNIINYCGN